MPSASVARALAQRGGLLALLLDDVGRRLLDEVRRARASPRRPSSSFSTLPRSRSRRSRTAPGSTTPRSGTKNSPSPATMRRRLAARPLAVAEQLDRRSTLASALMSASTARTRSPRAVGGDAHRHRACSAGCRARSGCCGRASPPRSAAPMRCLGVGVAPARRSACGYGAIMIDAVGRCDRQRLPDLLGDERHERMQQAHRLIEHRARSVGARASLRRLVGAVERGLLSSRYQSQNSPQMKLVERDRRVVEPVRLERARASRRSPLCRRDRIQRSGERQLAAAPTSAASARRSRRRGSSARSAPRSRSCWRSCGRTRSSRRRSARPGRPARARRW